MPDDVDRISEGPPFDVRKLMQTEPRPLSVHPAMVYLAGLSDGSRRTMFQALDTIATFLSGGQLTVFDIDWSALRYEHTTAIRSFLETHYKPATANKMLSAVRQVLFHAWKMNYLSEEDFRRARSITNVRGDMVSTGRDPDQDEIAALLAVCEADPSPAGARDAAIIALLYSTGIRRTSLVRLTIDDYDAQTQSLSVQDAQGGKAITVYVSQDGTQRALVDWLALRGLGPGALFWPVNKAGKIASRPLSAQAVYNVLMKRAQQAGIEPLSPHDLRRAFAGELLDAGADMTTVREILGYAQGRAMASDGGGPEDVKREAASLIRVPYRGRRPASLDET